MNEIKQALNKLNELKKSYEVEQGIIKKGFHYRWNQVFRDICVLENAIEILKMMEN